MSTWSGVILVHALTEATDDDATTALDLLTAVEGHLVRVIADAAYDTLAVYETAAGAGCDGRYPTGQDSERLWARPAGSPTRDRTITLVKTLGRRRWKQASGYHVRAGWRTRSSATRPALAMAFAPGVQRGRGVRSSSAVRSSIG